MKKKDPDMLLGIKKDVLLICGFNEKGWPDHTPRIRKLSKPIQDETNESYPILTYFGDELQFDQFLEELETRLKDSFSIEHLKDLLDQPKYKGLSLILPVHCKKHGSINMAVYLLSNFPHSGMTCSRFTVYQAGLYIFPDHEYKVRPDEEPISGYFVDLFSKGHLIYPYVTTAYTKKLEDPYAIVEGSLPINHRRSRSQVRLHEETHPSKGVLVHFKSF